MSERPLRFRHEVIDPDPPGTHHDIVLLGDLAGDGRPDILGKPCLPKGQIDAWLNET